MMRRFLLATLMLCFNPFLLAQVPVGFSTSVSQTSLFPGDHFTYRVTLKVPETVQIALEDLDPRSVNFEPFQLVSRTLKEDALEGGITRYRVDYELLNKVTGDQKLEIPRLIVRYEDRASADSGPATREMQIPPYPIVVKSTLNHPVESSWIRESLASAHSDRAPWVWIAVGLAGVLLSALPLVGWMLGRAPQWKQQNQQMGRKEFASQWQAAIEELEAAAVQGSQDAKSQYDRLRGLVRGYASFFWELDSDGLTHRELGAMLGQTDTWNSTEKTLLLVLEHGEQCCYSQPSPDQWESTLRDDLEAIKRVELGARRSSDKNR